MTVLLLFCFISTDVLKALVGVESFHTHWMLNIFLPGILVAVSVIKICSSAPQFNICTPEGSELIVGCNVSGMAAKLV